MAANDEQIRKLRKKKKKHKSEHKFPYCSRSSDLNVVLAHVMLEANYCKHHVHFT